MRTIILVAAPLPNDRSATRRFGHLTRSGPHLVPAKVGAACRRAWGRPVGPNQLGRKALKAQLNARLGLSRSARPKNDRAVSKSLALRAQTGRKSPETSSQQKAYESPRLYGANFNDWSSCVIATTR